MDTELTEEIEVKVVMSLYERVKIRVIVVTELSEEIEAEVVMSLYERVKIRVIVVRDLW